MPEIKSALDIGMKGLRVLAKAPDSERLDVISEGLPVLMRSAEELLEAAEALEAHPRGADILVGQASEELAKVLVLIDLVRCPAKLRASRVTFMVKWFYSHLARLLYVASQSWNPMDVAQLQQYIDGDRRSHYLDGAVGEFIFPNSAVFMRESQLYADLILHDDGQFLWNEPSNDPVWRSTNRPHVWDICAALRGAGALTRRGLDIVGSTWGQTEFGPQQDAWSRRPLTQDMLESLDEAGLIAGGLTKAQLYALYNPWQVPMYLIDFRQIDVPLEQLVAEKDANISAEMGGWI